MMSDNKGGQCLKVHLEKKGKTRINRSDRRYDPEHGRATGLRSDARSDK